MGFGFIRRDRETRIRLRKSKIRRQSLFDASRTRGWGPLFCKTTRPADRRAVVKIHPRIKNFTWSKASFRLLFALRKIVRIQQFTTPIRSLRYPHAQGPASTDYRSSHALVLSIRVAPSFFCTHRLCNRRYLRSSLSRPKI